MAGKETYTSEEVERIASGYGDLIQAITRLESFIYAGSPTTLGELTSEYDSARKAVSLLRELVPSTGITGDDPNGLRTRLGLSDLEGKFSSVSSKDIRAIKKSEE